MNKKFCKMLIAIVVASGLSGCKAKVDFENVDTRIQADMGLAIPVGAMMVTTNDFLGGDRYKQIVVDEEGIYHFIDTVDIPTRNYHKVNLSEYVGSTDKVFTVKSQMEANGYINAEGWVKKDKKDIPLLLRFPLTVQLNGLNRNPSDERIDSVQVSDANFKSVVNVTELGLRWEWINSVDVVLNSQFRRQAGQTVRLYSKGDGYGYGQEIPIEVDAFTVSLMRDKAGEPGADNVVDTCGFTFLFTFTVPSNQDVQIKDNSSFDYHFETQFIDFDAAWGFFQSSKDMRDRDQFSIDSIWSEWKNIKKLKVKLMEPEVTVKAHHHVAAPLLVYIDTLMVSNSTERVWGTWNGQTSTTVLLPEVLSPYSSLEDSIEHTYIFNEDPDKGHIDRLFTIRPDSLYYSFRLMVDPNPRQEYIWKQHRVTNNTELVGYAKMDIPFKFDKESEAEYITKITDVDFTRINLDSLLKSVKVLEKTKVRTIKLYMLWENGLPFEVDAKVKFLKQDSSVINISIFDNQSQNRVHLSAPKMVREAGDKYGRISEPSESVIIMDVTQAQFDSLALCKHLWLDAYMGSNIEPCQIDTATSLNVHIGVAADMNAIVDMKNAKK